MGKPHRLERVARLGAVHRPDQPAHVLAVLAQRRIGGLRQIPVATQPRPRQPNREDRVLAKELLQLGAQIDRAHPGRLGAFMDPVDRGRRHRRRRTGARVLAMAGRGRRGARRQARDDQTNSRAHTTKATLDGGSPFGNRIMMHGQRLLPGCDPTRYLVFPALRSHSSRILGTGSTTPVTRSNRHDNGHE